MSDYHDERRIEALQAEVVALRAAVVRQRAAVRELAESPPMASMSLCCKIIRIGHWSEATMHDGTCRERHGGELGKTYYLHDVDALLSGAGGRNVTVLSDNPCPRCGRLILDNPCPRCGRLMMFCAARRASDAS